MCVNILLNSIILSLKLFYTQDVSIELGKDTLDLEELFTISITLCNESIESYSRFPEIKGFTKTTTSSSTKTSVDNGQISIFQSIIQYYKPLEEGTFILSPFSMRVNDSEIESTGQTINVKPVERIIFNGLANYQLNDYISLKGHPKAKGVNMIIRSPTNWEIQEGDRPNIVKKFINSNGSTFLVQVRENTTFISKRLAKELLEEITAIEILGEMAEMVSGLKIYKLKNVTVDNYPAKYIQYGGVMERAGISFMVQSYYWVCYYEDTIVTLNGMYLGKVKDPKMESLFFKIVNSVQFPDQWE